MYLSDWLCGKLSDHQLQKKEGEEKVKQYKRILKAVDHLSVIPPKQLHWDHFSRQTLPVKKRNMNIGYLMAAAALLVIVFLSDFYTITSKTFHAQHKVQTVHLPDGSTAILHPGSTVRHSIFYNWFERKIAMEGDVIFNVKKGHPFEVETPLGTVNVLGTIFRVLHTDAFFMVGCRSGKVSVKYDQDEVVLTTGKSFNNQTKEIIPYNDKSRSEESIDYTKVPLTYVVSVVEKLYDLEIKLDTDQRYFFTGRIPLNDKALALQVISAPFGMTVTERGAFIYMYD